jgi:hypothetical protein
VRTKPHPLALSSRPGTDETPGTGTGASGIQPRALANSPHRIGPLGAGKEGVRRMIPLLSGRPGALGKSGWDFGERS